LKDNAPLDYFTKILNQIAQNNVALGTIESVELLKQNLEANDIPETILTATAETYKDFLLTRRKLISNRIKKYYYEWL
jgi:chromosome condensin MukBEF ATPase and DNA-binding subunit MukB